MSFLQDELRDGFPDEAALPDHQARRFGLLAGAVAGRAVQLAVDGDAERAWTDGEVVHVPPGGDDDVRDALVVQAALLAAGSLDPKTVGRTTGRRAVRHRYLLLEAVRAFGALGPVVPSVTAARLRAVWDGPPSASAEESARRAVDDDAVPDAPAWMGTLKPGQVISAAVQESASAPRAGDERLAGGENPFDELDDEEESERSRIMELFSAPSFRNPLAEAFQKLLGAGRSPSADGEGGDEVAVGGARIGRVGRAARKLAAPVALHLDLGDPPLGVCYPEWDAEQGRYKPDWCTVSELDPALRDDLEPDAGQDREVQRQLARLGLALERRPRQVDGDVLDPTGLLDLVIDRLTGADPDPRIYETKHRSGHDLGVLVLLDCTGSTGDAEDGRRVFDEQRRVAARLIAALDQLGNRVAGHAFQSYGRHRVRFLRIKDFDDRFDHAAQRRLATLEPAGFTRLGAAVRHGTSVLTTQAGTVNRLLVVVGDGLPYDDGYEGRHAQEDSRRALDEAVTAGVGCACVSVRTATDDHVLERVWGHVPYLRLEDSDDLARHVTPLFRRGLREADLLSRMSPVGAGTTTSPPR